MAREMKSRIFFDALPSWHHRGFAKVMVWRAGSQIFIFPSSQTLHPHVPAPSAHAAAPAERSQSFVLLLERWEWMFCGRGFAHSMLLRWRFLRSGKPLEPLFFLNIREKAGCGEGVGIWGGFQTSPRSLFAHPGHVLDRQPDTEPCSLLQPQLPTPPECPNAWIFPLDRGQRSSCSLLLIQSS